MSSISLKFLFAFIFCKVVSCYYIYTKKSEISLSNSTDVEDFKINTTFLRSMLYTATFTSSSPSVSNHSTRSSEPKISTSASYSTYFESKTRQPDYNATDSVPKFSVSNHSTRSSDPEISTSASYSTYFESKTRQPDYNATDSVPKFTVSNHSTISSEPEISTAASYSTYFESKTRQPDYNATDSVPKFSAATFYTRDSSISDYHTTKNKQKLLATTYDTRHPERRYRSKFYIENSELSSSASVYYITSESNSNSNKKDASLFSCSLITIEHGEYIISSNDTLLIEISNLALSSSFYIHDGDAVVFCESGVMDEATEKEYWKTANSLLPLCITEIVLIVLSLSLRILQ